MTVVGVTPAAIRRELERLGFSVADREGRAGDTWSLSGAPDAPAVLVPRESDQEVAGYDETLQSAVDRLSWITGESPAETAERLSGVAGRLELRIVHAMTARHSLRVLDAPNVVSGFVNVIKSGARTRFNGARADHRGPGGDDFDAALQDIELLAPEPGSFRLIAVTSSAPQLSVDEDEGVSTPARDTLATTLRSLAALGRQTTAPEDLDDDDVERLVDDGVSVQLLNAVDQLTFVDTAGLQLEFSGRWDLTLGEVDVPAAPVLLTDVQIALARGLKSRLKPYEPNEGYELVGWVETAQADELHPHGRPTGTVIVRGRINNRNRDVRVALDGDDFPKAKPGVSMLSATGTLERISGRWHLTDPVAIEVRVAQPPPT